MNTESWRSVFVQVGADLEGLASTLTKPLRPLWLGHNSRVLPPDQQPDLGDLAFTPLYLVSASEPNMRHRIVPGIQNSKSCSSALPYLLYTDR